MITKFDIKYSRILLILLLISTHFGCNKKSEDKTKKNELPGTYFTLKEDKIKIFLPSYFSEYSEEEYDSLIDTLEDSYEKELERNRFNYLKFSKGNIYYFKDIASSTFISVKMMQFIPFTRKESSQLLGMLSQSCNNHANLINANCTKITAGYSESSQTKVFKAVYEIANDQDYLIYNNIYLIASNYKTFAINIYSTNNKNYNSFIEKIIVG